MSRISQIRSSVLPYNISSRCINQEWFEIPLDQVWNIFSEQLFFLHHGFGIDIHAFVLMSNHYHLIASSPRNNLSEGMAYFLRETSRNLSFRSGRINQHFGGRYYRSVLSSYHYYLHAYKYVYMNPVKAGICQRAEQYPYSTLGGLLGLQKIYIPLKEDLFLFKDVEFSLRWLNTHPTQDDWSDIKKALKKGQFKLRQIDKRSHHLESCLF